MRKILERTYELSQNEVETAIYYWLEQCKDMPMGSDPTYEFGCGGDTYGCKVNTHDNDVV